MKTNLHGTTVLAALALVTGSLLATPAFAQKSKDTLRFSVTQPISVADEIYNPQPATQVVTKSVFDRLINFDHVKREYTPALAESWNRIDDKTVEFKLRQDIKFHDGSKFDADDVVYTINFMKDPDAKFRFKGTRIGWIASVDKVDQYTVRVTAKGPYAIHLAKLSAAIPIVPSDVHSSLDDPSTFGKVSPVGTGPYKITKVDQSEGIFLEKNPDYKGDDVAPAGKIGKVHVTSIADNQTQIARMLAGEQDLMYAVPRDAAEQLEKNRNLKVSIQPTISFDYMYFDAADKSGIGVLKDQKVRLALSHAIDRKGMAKAMLPAEVADQPLPGSMCDPWLVGCAFDTPLPEYDPAKAKALLKEAGLEDGFDLALTTWGTSREAAEVITGYLRDVGVRATVDAVTFGVYNKKRVAGTVQTFVSHWDNGGAQPDVDTTSGFYFLPGVRNYHGDTELEALHREGAKYPDLEKRKSIYKELFNKANERAYFLPLVPIPAIVVHNKDLEIVSKRREPYGFLIHLVEWK